MKQGIRKVFLHPGEFVFGEPGTHVHTVLGSCIAICLWHPVLHIGGMCHFVLPNRPKGTPIASDFDGRYGDEAMLMFDQAIKLHRTSYSDYQGKIFGGANSYDGGAGSEQNHVGERNAARAMQLLMDRNVEICVVHVGERGHRRIVMDIESGDVWVKHQSPENAPSMKSQNGRV